MGEESITPVYIAKYEDGKVIFEPLTEFEVPDTDITDTNQSDDIVVPGLSIQSIMKQPITLRAFLRRKGLRGFYKAIGMPAYLRTEYLFPKKKKRGTARRKRRMKRAELSFINFIKAKYGGRLTGTRATNVIIDEYTFAGPFEGEEDI